MGTFPIITFFYTFTILIPSVVNAAHVHRGDFRSSRGNVALSVPVIAKTNFTRSPQAAVAKAYGRYGFKYPSDSYNHNKRQTDATIINAPTAGDSEYISIVNIGGQDLRMDFDTGSADTWVFSTDLPDYSGHMFYSPANSTTFQDLPGESWYIVYADDSFASGTVGTDMMTVGDLEVTGQAIELASEVSSDYIQDVSSDGLVGLAFSSINTVRPNKQFTFFENALAQLQSPLFTAYLKHEAPGSYDFGYIDPAKYTAPLYYAKVYYSSGFWKVTSNWYKILGEKYYEVSYGIIDTGTSLILMSDTAVANYYANIPGSGYSAANEGYIFPCGTAIPGIKLKIGGGASGYYAKVPASLLNWGNVDNTGTMCFGAIQSRGLGNLNIYGDVFLKANFVVFDRTGGSARIGVAPHL